MEDKSLYEQLRKIIAQETKFLRTYLGQVMDIADTLFQGRVLVTIPELGWFTNDMGVWASPCDKKSMIVPKMMDWVIVFFLNGNPDRPYYIGVSGEIMGMKPQNYAAPTDKILWESNDKDAYIKYDEALKSLKLSDANGNTIEMTAAEIKINGTNLEVLT